MSYDNEATNKNTETEELKDMLETVLDEAVEDVIEAAEENSEAAEEEDIEADEDAKEDNLKELREEVAALKADISAATTKTVDFMGNAINTKTVYYKRVKEAYSKLKKLTAKMMDAHKLGEIELENKLIDWKQQYEVIEQEIEVAIKASDERVETSKKAAKTVKRSKVSVLLEKIGLIIFGLLIIFALGCFGYYTIRTQNAASDYIEALKQSSACGDASEQLNVAEMSTDDIAGYAYELVGISSLDDLSTFDNMELTGFKDAATFIKERYNYAVASGITYTKNTLLYDFAAYSNYVKSLDNLYKAIPAVEDVYDALCGETYHVNNFSTIKNTFIDMSEVINAVMTDGEEKVKLTSASNKLYRCVEKLYDNYLSSDDTANAYKEYGKYSLLTGEIMNGEAFIEMLELVHNPDAALEDAKYLYIGNTEEIESASEKTVTCATELMSFLEALPFTTREKVETFVSNKINEAIADNMMPITDDMRAVLSKKYDRTNFITMATFDLADIYENVLNAENYPMQWQLTLSLADTDDSLDTEAAWVYAHKVFLTNIGRAAMGDTSGDLIVMFGTYNSELTEAYAYLNEAIYQSAETRFNYSY